MLRHRPDLIVPIRDRRQHKRYLTLKNFGVVAIVSLVAFAAISIRSEMRDLRTGDYGRLFGREAAVQIEQKPVEVVQEAPPVGDATHADPMLVEPAARAQWLQDDTAPVTTTVVPVTTADIRGGHAEVAIVGGAGGVAVVRKERRAPVLSGGFGR